MRFVVPKGREQQMTAEDAHAIRGAAHEKGWHSIALAQAFQFELRLRQLDAIGEWVPLAEKGSSEIIYGNEKWLRGLRWSQISEDLIFEHTTTNKLEKPKEIKVDLRQYPMIMEELARERTRLGKLPASGPMIICETNEKPYSTNEFRRKWRIVANRAGVPNTVQNTDSARAEKNTAGTMPAARDRARGVRTHLLESGLSSLTRGQHPKKGLSPILGSLSSILSAFRPWHWCREASRVSRVGWSARAVV